MTKSKTIKRTIRMTEGSIARHLLSFAIPIFLANILQQFYNLADSKIVAMFLGENAFSAVASTASLSNLFLGFAFGFTYGFSIIMAKHFGSGDMNKLKKTYASSLYLAVIISIILTALELIFLKPILILMNAPPEILNESIEYMSVIIIGTPFAIMYNLFANTLRSLGNSKVSLYVLFASVLLNIGLDLFCVAVLKLGIIGAALATITAQFMCAILCYAYIVKKVPELKTARTDFKSTVNEIKHMLSLGFSMAIMNSLVSLGSIFLQSSINSFGTSVISGHSAGRRLDEIVMMPHASLANALAVFTGQNYGAKRLDRVKKSIVVSLVICTICNAVAIVATLIIGKWFVAWLSGTTSQETVSIGYLYLVINVPSQLILAVMHSFRGVLQGVGKGFISSLTGAIELLIKAFFTFIVAKEVGYLAIAIAEPISWLLMTILSIIVCVSFLKKSQKEPELSVKLS